MIGQTKVALKTIGYVIFYVTDMKRSLLFYRDVLGTKVKMEDGGWVELDTNGTILALHERPAGTEPKGPTQLIFTVDDIRGTYESLKNEGVKFEREPQKVCDVGPDKIALVADFVDPDGNKICICGEVAK